MKVQDIISLLENVAAPSLQEDYDNAGLITGQKDWECKGVLVALDCTEDVVKDAIQKKCNLVVAHHPIVFKGLKTITGKNYVEQSIITAIKHDIAIYAIHTNLDNVLDGVNGKIADMLGLINCRILLPKKQLLQKLAVFVPLKEKQHVIDALFAAGAGNIGNYSECSFSSTGQGSFKAGQGSDPFVGNIGERHLEEEARIEVIFPEWLQAPIVKAMKVAHPYEEVAYDIYGLENQHSQTGSGLLGELQQEVTATEFLQKLQELFKTPVIKHTAVTGKAIKKVALCGGAGSFLTWAAIAAGADIYITSDIKYHEFFDAGGKLLLADVGHYESEQFTIDLLFDLLQEKFPNFTVLKTGINTNPVQYFTRKAD